MNSNRKRRRGHAGQEVWGAPRPPHVRAPSSLAQLCVYSAARRPTPVCAHTWCSPAAADGATQTPPGTLDGSSNCDISGEPQALLVHSVACCLSSPSVLKELRVSFNTDQKDQRKRRIQSRGVGGEGEAQAVGAGPAGRARGQQAGFWGLGVSGPGLARRPGSGNGPNCGQQSPLLASDWGACCVAHRPPAWSVVLPATLAVLWLRAVLCLTRVGTPASFPGWGP